jgi:hypothetical protein
LAARSFLHQLRGMSRSYAAAVLAPDTLHDAFAQSLKDRSTGYQAGFIQALLAFVQLNLEASDFEVETWDVIGFLSVGQMH